MRHLESFQLITSNALLFLTQALLSQSVLVAFGLTNKNDLIGKNVSFVANLADLAVFDEANEQKDQVIKMLGDSFADFVDFHLTGALYRVVLFNRISTPPINEYPNRQT